MNESVEVARLHENGERWDDTIARAMTEGATTLPKAASNRRTLREIVNRISCLTEDERGLLIDADRHEQEALLWLAACRAYRFMREFAVEVLQERLLSYRPELSLESFDHFFDGKAEWDDGLAQISPSTRAKLRQVMFRVMREAGVIDASDTIRPAYLSSRLHALIARHDEDDLFVFPGLKP